MGVCVWVSLFVCSLAFGSIVTRATNADRGTTHRDLGTHHSCLPSRFRTHTLAWLAAAAWGTRVCLLVCLCAQFRAPVLSVCLSVCLWVASSSKLCGFAFRCPRLLLRAREAKTLFARSLFESLQFCSLQLAYRILLKLKLGPGERTFSLLSDDAIRFDATYNSDLY